MLGSFREPMELFGFLSETIPSLYADNDWLMTWTENKRKQHIC